MPLMRPDPTFYPPPRMAMQSPPEKLAYVALINPGGQGAADAIGTVDVGPDSRTYGRMVGRTEMPNPGDELHHFGWNACSSCLCPYAELSSRTFWTLRASSRHLIRQGTIDRRAVIGCWRRSWALMGRAR